MRIFGYGALLIPAAGLLAATSSPTAAAAPTLAAELGRCAAITAESARLACYDALSRQAAAAPAPGGGQAKAAATAAVAPAATAPAPLSVAVLPGTPAGAGSTEPADAIQNFGLSNAQRHAPPQGPDSIQAHVAQVMVDQLQRNYVVLDNGQTWASTDGELLLNAGELVTIGRGALGSFMLVSAKSRHSYHVRRVR